MLVDIGASWKNAPNDSLLNNAWRYFSNDSVFTFEEEITWPKVNPPKLNPGTLQNQNPLQQERVTRRIAANKQLQLSATQKRKLMLRQKNRHKSTTPHPRKRRLQVQRPRRKNGMHHPLIIPKAKLKRNLPQQSTAMPLQNILNQKGVRQSMPQKAPQTRS
jgi:hypothetical protein